MIARMNPRRLGVVLKRRLEEAPAVALLGPRHVGKTTLALELGSDRGDALYLDLESERDRAKLAEPALYLSNHLERLVILDEIDRAPGLFPVLRGLIDRARREGRRSGLFLLLGSAALDLMRQSGETLAGRMTCFELHPFGVLEVDAAQSDRLWLRGGFPESFFAPSDAQSLRWRQDFVRSYVERDVPQLGRRIAAERLRRFWTMLSHRQGAVLNVAQLARDLGVDAKTAASYVDLLVDLMLVRRLRSWQGNVGKRLVKSPKVYVRDSGLVHALLGLDGKEALLSHPVVGASWEGFVVEQLLAAAPEGAQGHFYRASGGAEVDLVLSFAGGGLWAVEIERSLTPHLGKGFHSACADLQPDRRFVVYPGEGTYFVRGGVQAIPLRELAWTLAEAKR